MPPLRAADSRQLRSPGGTRAITAGVSDPRGGTEGRGFTLGSSSHRATRSPCQAGVAPIFTPGPLAIGHRCAGAVGAAQCGPTSSPEGAPGSASPSLDLQRLLALPSRAPPLAEPLRVGTPPGRAPCPQPASHLRRAPPSRQSAAALRAECSCRPAGASSPPRPAASPPPAGPPPTPPAPPRTCSGAGPPSLKVRTALHAPDPPAGLFPGSRHSLRCVFQRGPVPRHVRPAVTNLDLL